MKRHYFMVLAVFVCSLALPPVPASAQKAQPAVPITYPGDTDQTIGRRAKWIEGAKKEGMLVWWGSARPESGYNILKEFNKIYPFIQASYWRGGPSEMAAKLEAEFMGNRYNTDVTLGGDPINYPRWRDIGLTTKFTDFIPNIRNLDKRMYGVNGDWAMPGHTVVIPIYNTKLVPRSEAPKDWEDLLDPKWRGHIAIGPFTRRWATMALAEGGWGLEKTENYLRKLAGQKLIYAAGYIAGRTLTIAGESRIMVENHLHGVFIDQEKGAPIDWVRANPVLIEGSALILMKKAPHPNAAMLFLEWLFSPPGLAVFEKSEQGKGCAFPGSGTRQSEAIKGMSLAVRTEEIERQAIEMGLIEKFDKILGSPGM